MFESQRSILALLGLLLVATTVDARKDDAFVLDPEPVRPRYIEEREAWKEGRVSLPSWPKDENLVEFEPDGPASPFRFFIDSQSLDTDSEGGVVRYTLVAQSKGGIRNISYEGIRCTLKGAYKVYAYGSRGAFSESMESDWLPISTLGSEAYREDLWRHRFCVPRETRLRPKSEMIRSLQTRGVPGEHTGFQTD